jgi:hypothetical protein
VPAKIPTWSFAQAVFKQCTTQNETAIIFPKEEFMAAYYSASLEAFRKTNSEEVVGVLAAANFQNLLIQQTRAWQEQIEYLHNQLPPTLSGKIFFEFVIPRMGKRADCVILTNNCVLVIEFKVNATAFDSAAIDQVHDYALDLKNFHAGSHNLPIVPIIVATGATKNPPPQVEFASDMVAQPLRVGAKNFGSFVLNVLQQCRPYCGTTTVAADEWASSGYLPTPTIIEAAQALYQSHNVTDIARSDSGAKNLAQTSDEIARLVEDAKANKKKIICFVTGVPGAGKTLAGLNIAALRSQVAQDEHAVFLSGNGPLVAVLREALARDEKKREGTSKSAASRRVNSFVQNIHHFRDEYFKNYVAPSERVVIFDEAQRAWSEHQATKFMTQKWGGGYAPQSEPQFLISVMDRHPDWCCVVCLIGGGQEINTGEAGIVEWLNALSTNFPHWNVYVSDMLSDPNYTVDADARDALATCEFIKNDKLHLSVSMRSFRAEKLSTFVSKVIEAEPEQARSLLSELGGKYPVRITRSLPAARNWLQTMARGTERTGLVASSGALRLRPEGIFVKSTIDPANWFLNDKDDVRSSYYMEDVATQFDIQGLELDWVGVCWDADMRYENAQWVSYAFKGTKWQNIGAEQRQIYQLNAYRVLLTRARQGMVIFIPKGDPDDPTRPPAFYDPVWEFFKACGIDEISS